MYSASRTITFSYPSPSTFYTQRQSASTTPSTPHNTTSRSCCSPAWVPRKSGTGPLGLDTAESLQLLGLHRHLLSETNLPGRALDEADTVGVQALVDGGGTALSPGHGHTTSLGSSLSSLLLVARAKGFDDGGLHGELDEIEGQEPDDVPHPDDTDPAGVDVLDVGEAPVSVAGNDGRDKLSKAECDDESSGGTFHEEEAVGTSDEDKSLGDDSDLEIGDHVQLRIVGLDGVGTESDAELVLEEGCLLDDDDKGDTERIGYDEHRKEK